LFYSNVSCAVCAIFGLFCKAFYRFFNRCKCAEAAVFLLSEICRQNFSPTVETDVPVAENKFWQSDFLGHLCHVDNYGDSILCHSNRKKNFSVAKMDKNGQIYSNLNKQKIMVAVSNIGVIHLNQICIVLGTGVYVFF